MIWEVDELGDNVIDWDEFQLTYYRNIVSILSNIISLLIINYFF